MSNARNSSLSSRPNSLSSNSLSSSMESLSSTHADSYWMDQQDLVPTRSAFTIPRAKAKTSDYETGFSAAEYDEDEEQLVNVAGRVKKVRLQICIIISVPCCIGSYLNVCIDVYIVNNSLCFPVFIFSHFH